MKYIDLRSDTVSHPTPEMREAMAYAEVGDDVYGDDPTVNALEATAAEMFGKEAALFVASGTMGNLCSVLAHCGRGDEMILGKQAHIFRYEAGGAAAYGGIQPNTLEVERDGTMSLDAIRGAIRQDNIHFPVTKLVCLENTHGGAGGAPVPASYIAQVADIARANGLKLHIDGARIFNAATALNTTVDVLCAEADSVSVCLSKGLCAPVGSVVVGDREFIRRAHRIRKSVGGGMRQAGILAAAGLIALKEMSKRLGEDHANARALAEALAAIPYVHVDMEAVKTNMLFFWLSADAPVDALTLSDVLKDRYNILLRPYVAADRSFRVVTHYWFRPEHVALVANAVRETLSVGSPEMAGD
ncbi:MAG: low-specificity L-threonine aldolase [Pleurocapsa minor GSE-CHR-MK-17-07R]|jgi:threonine aldolase|nr:low-specificity L-threonine aldolase [Pleurocapsa minor GSE-CHR-MK 17-07R]